MNQKRRGKYTIDKAIDNNESRKARHWDKNKDLFNEKRRENYATEKTELEARKLESLTSNNNSEQYHEQKFNEKIKKDQPYEECSKCEDALQYIFSFKELVKGALNFEEFCTTWKLLHNH